MTIRLLHTADWQIGKSFGEIEGDAGAILRAQRLKTIEKLAQVANEENIDVILVAGDVFDTNAVSDETLRRLVQATRGYDGPWILLPGNHDAALAESAWTRLQRIGLPGNVVPALRPEPILLLGERLAVLPAPLQRRHEANDITEWFDNAHTPAHTIRVGLAHGSVANRLPRPSEAPNTIADDRSDRARLSYLALGDWHGTLEIAPRTWYSGTPEPDRFRDNDPGNALIVTLESPTASPQVRKLAVGHFRWKSIEQGVFSAEDAAALSAALDGESDPQRLVASLRAWGAVDFATRQTLEDEFERHKARFHVLRLDADELVATPSNDDLDRIDSIGFIRSAIDELRTTADDPANPDRDVARAALQRLYLEHLRLGG